MIFIYIKEDTLLFRETFNTEIITRNKTTRL